MKLNRWTHLFAASTLAASGWAVQAATVIDLATGNGGTAIGAATYTWNDYASTGTGVLNSFVQIGGANKDTVEGYNTTVNGVFDNASSDIHNHAITVGSIGLVTIGANSVMRFVLDVNQTGADPLLNLDEVQIFVSTSPNQGVTSKTGDVVNMASSFLAYRMDASDVGNMVTLDYSRNSGGGSGDMTLDLLASALDPAFAALGLTTAAQKNGAYIYLYSKFGSGANLNNDGFEEWGYVQGTAITEPPCVPTPTNPCNPPIIAEPNALSVVAFGLLALGAVTRRRQRRH